MGFIAKCNKLLGDKQVPSKYSNPKYHNSSLLVVIYDVTCLRLFKHLLLVPPSYVVPYLLYVPSGKLT